MRVVESVIKYERMRFFGDVAAKSMAILLLIVFPVALWLLDRWALVIDPYAYLSWSTVLRNAMPGLLLLLLLWSLTRRLLFPMLVVWGLHGALYLASSVKLEVLGSPVSLQDRYFLSNFGPGSIEIFGAYTKGYPLVGWSIACVLAFGAAFLLERPWFSNKKLVRWGSAGLSFSALASLWMAGWPWGAIYTQENIRASKLASLPAVLRSGLVSSLVYKHLEISNVSRVLDVAALNALLEQSNAGDAGAKVVPSEYPPDIVVVMSESFIDPRILRGMESVPDLIGNIRGQIEKGRGGLMDVPTYGGGTVRTEFEVLTGMPLAAFPETQFPYADLPRRSMPGLAAILAQWGYTTSAVHGNAGSFWNRASTYRSMGFNRFVTERDFEAKADGFRDGRWYSDETMTDIILDELDQEPSKPKFVFAISMQAHGPYHDKVELKDTVAWENIGLPEELRGESELSLRNHLYHVKKADEQFGRLLQELNARDRPFVLAFFGDHLPGLPEVYSTLGFTDGEDAKGQMVPWVLIRGGGEPSSFEVAPPRHAWQLPAQVLAAAGVGTPYFSFLGWAGNRMDKAQNAEEKRAIFSGILTASALQLDGKFEEYVK